MLFETSKATLEHDNPLILDTDTLSATVLNSNFAFAATMGFKVSPPAEAVVVTAPFPEIILFVIENGPVIETPPASPVFAVMTDESIVTLTALIASTPATSPFL